MANDLFVEPVDPALFPFDPTQQVGAVPPPRVSITGMANAPTEGFGLPDIPQIIQDIQSPAEPAQAPTPAPQQPQGVPPMLARPAEGPAQPQVPGLGGLEGALARQESALNQLQQGEQQRAGVLAPVETTKWVTPANPDGSMGNPVLMPKERDDYAAELQELLAANPNGMNQAQQIRAKELGMRIDQLDQQQRAQQEKVAYDNYFTKQAEQEAEFKKFYDDTFKAEYAQRKAKIQEIQNALDAKLANGEMGMSGQDWATFLGLGLLSGVAKGIGLGRKKQPGLILKFADMWAQNQVNKQEKQIELYRLGLTNQRNSLADLHQELGDRDAAKQMMLGSLKAKLAADLKGVADQYPMTDQKAAEAIISLSQSKQSHDQALEANAVKFADDRTKLAAERFKLAQIKQSALAPQRPSDTVLKAQGEAALYNKALGMAEGAGEGDMESLIPAIAATAAQALGGSQESYAKVLTGMNHAERQDYIKRLRSMVNAANGARVQALGGAATVVGQPGFVPSYDATRQRPR